MILNKTWNVTFPIEVSGLTLVWQELGLTHQLETSHLKFALKFVSFCLAVLLAFVPPLQLHYFGSLHAFVIATYQVAHNVGAYPMFISGK